MMPTLSDLQRLSYVTRTIGGTSMASWRFLQTGIAICRPALHPSMAPKHRQCFGIARRVASCDTEALPVLRYRMKQLFARYRAQLAVTIISIRVQGPLAFDWGWHKLTLTPKKGGRSMTTRTRYLEIWQKGADGRWKIAIFLDNPDVPPQMPPKEVLREMGNGSLGRTKSKVIAIA